MWIMDSKQFSEYSFGFLDFAAFHKHFLLRYQEMYLRGSLGKFTWMNPYCHVVFFNLMMNDLTLRPPLLIQKEEDEEDHSSVHFDKHAMKSSKLIFCLNKVSSFDRLLQFFKIKF